MMAGVKDALARKWYSRRLVRGSFGHNVLVMFTGTAIGQLGSVILSPFLTRIYSPEAFGILGAFTALIAILSVVASLRYEMALPLACNGVEAANLLAICGVALLITTLASAGLFIFLPQALHLVHLDALLPYRLLLPVGFFCIGAYQVMVYYATQQGAFNAIARTKIYQGVAGPVSQIALGLAGLGVWGLIAGFIVGQSTGSGMLFSRLVLKPASLRAANTQAMGALARRFLRFPLLSSWSGLINALGTSHFLLVIIPILYSNAIAGFVFLTDRIVGRPLLLISTSILQVYVGETSKALATDPQAVRRRFLQLARHQLVIVSAWLLVVNSAAPYVFPPLFGQEWQAAVPYLHVLSIAYLPQMVMHALVHTLQILERQGLSALWESGRLAAVIGVFVVSHALGLDALQALLFYSIIQLVAQIILFILMYRSIQFLQKASANAV